MGEPINDAGGLTAGQPDRVRGLDGPQGGGADTPQGTAGRKSGAKGGTRTRPKTKAAEPEAHTESGETRSPPGGPPPEPKPKPSDPADGGLLSALSSLTADGLERLSQRLTAVTVESQKLGLGALAQAETASSRPVRPDPYGLTPYFAEVATRLAADPEKLVAAQMSFASGLSQIWMDAMKGVMGEDVPPAPKDKRFADPDWSAMPVFDIMRRVYLHTSGWMNGLIDSVDGVDDLTRRKARFFTEQLSDAVSPSNFLMTNPVALREMILSEGVSVERGMANLQRDLARGHGRLNVTQVDGTPFKVGETVAVTPGKVVWRCELFELLQYNPTTDTVLEVPLLIFPPWINKFYILDLREDNSMIRWLTGQGHTVFVVSWVNPGPELATKTFQDYSVDGTREAITQVLAATGTRKVNAVGYCIGGTLLASTMCAMAEQGDERINTVTFFASQQDFIEAGDLRVFTDDAALQYIRDEIDAAGGVLDAAVMAETFNFLRANDLVWSFHVNNYLLGKDPKPFDLLFWNSDQTRMPRDLHLYYLDTFYRQNGLTEGKVQIDGITCDLSKVTVPVYMQSSQADHIAPYRSIFRGARQFGGPVRMIMAGSGHIAGVVNHPDAKKYQHWLPAAAPEDNAQIALPATVEEWERGLSEHKGSWWPDWHKWLAARSGGQVPARVPGDGALPVLGDAPGDYVKVMS
ncbi:MAG: class I poly(R)-hydroxyalkanoic acid synthase [Hyphomonadaceae bacterium]|nr:class I poly(R)-hydroxyalkanoic acid synthase [Hyphomonadaceae bacterium]